MRDVGQAGYKIGDIASLQASFCFVPLKKYDDAKPRVEFWEKIAERRALVAAQKGSLPAPTKKAPSLPKITPPAVPEFKLPFGN